MNKDLSTKGTCYIATKWLSKTMVLPEVTQNNSICLYLGHLVELNEDVVLFLFSHFPILL